MVKRKENFKLLAGTHHARLIDERVPFHIISRVFQGRHLLRPCTELNELIVGVIARARDLFPMVKLYAAAFMSNHMHILAQGSASDLPFFIGFIKREISRRWGNRPDIDWQGTMWHEYLDSALPTPKSQVECLQYILSQGVKENLVERPQDWPGVHAAKALMTGTKLHGIWFDSTAYSRAKDAASRQTKPRTIRRADYLQHRTLSFDALPAWAHLDAKEQRNEATKLVVEITREGRAKRQREQKKVLGVENVKNVPLDRATTLPKLPWLERRKRLICWADPRDPLVRAYVTDYWTFQAAFSEASKHFREGDLLFPFPARAFRPMTYYPPPSSNLCSSLTQDNQRRT